MKPSVPTALVLVLYRPVIWSLSLSAEDHNELPATAPTPQPRLCFSQNSREACKERKAHAIIVIAIDRAYPP
jgi:hypothetical protein